VQAPSRKAGQAPVSSRSPPFGGPSGHRPPDSSQCYGQELFGPSQVGAVSLHCACSTR